jgi:hypothetical protein
MRESSCADLCPSAPEIAPRSHHQLRRSSAREILPIRDTPRDRNARRDARQKGKVCKSGLEARAD